MRFRRWNLLSDLEHGSRALMCSEAVRSRLIVPLFSGQSRSCCPPGTDDLKRRPVREGALRAVLVAELLVTFQGALQIFVRAGIEW